jgi:Xaa-Pro dipeptidase
MIILNLTRKEIILNEINDNNALILLTPGKNLYYLTGIDIILTLERPFFYLIDVKNNYTYLIASKLYEKELDCTDYKKYYFYSDVENPFSIFECCLNDIILPGIGINLYVEKSLPCYVYENIKKIMKVNSTLYIDSLINKSRLIKSNDEISNIMKAAFLVDETFKNLCKESLTGKSEIEIAALIDYMMKTLGSRGPSFETIVAISENASNPHHIPTDRIARRGDSIVLDFGAIYNNYCSDITRTIFIGEPDSEAKKIYNIVKEAQLKAVEAVKEGVTIKDIDLAARDLIESYGYGDCFTHRTGHGIGLDIHEEPYITAENDDILMNGMIFTIEPGIYIDNKIGIRIEDDILVKDRFKILTKSTKELTILN